MKRIFYLVIVIATFISCNNGAGSKKQVAPEAGQADITEVLYFHGKQRCITCNAIEKLTQEVVDSLANDKVVMRIIDLSEKKNEAIADRYEVTWSSLILDRGGKVENLTDMGFSYAKGQPGIFKAKLVEAINNIAK